MTTEVHGYTDRNIDRDLDSTLRGFSDAENNFCLVSRFFLCPMCLAKCLIAFLFVFYTMRQKRQEREHVAMLHFIYILRVVKPEFTLAQSRLVQSTYGK